MPPQSNPRIIIIGAGAGGISAASRLMENGFANVKILEAEDRIGGRICTRNFGDGIVDLGAQYCRKDGVVYNLVKDFNLLDTITIDGHVYNSKGERLEKRFVKILLDIVSDIYHHEKVETVKWKDYLQNQFDEEVNQHFTDERDRSLARNNLDFIKKQLLLVTGSVCLNGALGAVSGEYPSGVRRLSWKSHGYQALLDFLMKTPFKSKSAFQFDDKIMLKNAVTNIEWGDEGNIMVECANGSHYFADYVIITISLGALKNQHKTLFSPPLPPRKQTAIASLGFGSIMKVAFYFPTKWWTNNDYTFAWSEDDLNCALKNDYPWVTNCKGFYLLPNNPKVLLAWFVGNSLSQIECCTEDHLLDGTYYVLQKFLGNTFENITKPIKLERIAWHNNPYFGGAFTYETLESTSGGITGETLAEVVVSKTGSPQLLFAGEATNKTEYSSVDSAVRSGFREADRIINICK